MSEHTPITGELRGTMFITESEQGTPMVELGWFRFKQLCDAIDAVHANLERENDLLRRKLDRVQEEREGLIELPKDADKVPIRVGDLIRSTFVGKVLAIEMRKDGWHVHTDQWSGHDFNTMHHHRPDSWERIIEDAVNVHGNGFNPCWTDERDALVARCKELCECTRGGGAE